LLLDTAREGHSTIFTSYHQTVWEHDKSFVPEGLEEYLASKDEKRISEAEDTIKFIENRVTEIIVSHFKKLHGNKYWNYIGTKEMRVKGLRTPTRGHCRKAVGFGGILGFYRQEETR